VISLIRLPLQKTKMNTQFVEKKEILQQREAAALTAADAAADAKIQFSTRQPHITRPSDRRRHRRPHQQQ
jgi:hypothetical protein